MGSKKAGKEARRVVGYIRVSSAEQVRDGESLERQREQIESYCRLKGLGAVEIISDEGVSGFKDNRPGFQKLIQLCTQKQVRVVIVYDLSRLSRSVRSTLAFVEDVIQKHGIEFVSIQQDIDTTSPMGKAFLSLIATFNQLYRDEISFKTKAALKHKKSKSEKTGGVIPFGYQLVEGGRLAALPSEASTVAFMHQLRKKGMSLREIVAELHAKGIPTKTGKAKWNPKMVKAVLERQIEAIACNPSLSDSKKDHLLEDVAGALYDTQSLEQEPEAAHKEAAEG